MKQISVKLTKPRSGPGGSYGVGDTIKVDPAEAMRLLSAGDIEPLKGAGAKEAAKAHQEDVERREKEVVEKEAARAELEEKLAAAQKFVDAWSRDSASHDLEEAQDAQAFLDQHKGRR